MVAVTPARLGKPCGRLFANGRNGEWASGRLHESGMKRFQAQSAGKILVRQPPPGLGLGLCKKKKSPFRLPST